jgi:hypothetical protein
MRIRRAAALVLTALLPSAVVGQDSPLSIHGLGIPGRFESARARASGGAFAPFDQLSALTDASMAGVARLTATAAGASTYLNDDFNGVSGSRRTARFPLFQVMGSLGYGIVLGGGFTTYLDRSYKVTITDTITLGGSGQAVTDDLASDGGITDVRLAVARRWGRLSLGAGFHLLAGSTRVYAVRTFSDTSAYRGVSESDEIAYHGVGYSASAVLAINARLAVTGFWRTDTRLASEVGAITTAVNELPQVVGGAIRWAPAPDLNFAGSVLRRSWAVAADSNAYNTTSWSAGAEVRLAGVPLRFGARGGDLPFGPGGRAPSSLRWPRIRVSFQGRHHRLRARAAARRSVGLTEIWDGTRRSTLRRELSIHSAAKRTSTTRSSCARRLPTRAPSWWTSRKRRTSRWSTPARSRTRASPSCAATCASRHAPAATPW